MSQSILGLGAVSVQDIQHHDTNDLTSAGQQAGEGHYKGDVVKAQCSGVSILDAAEEMTFAASETQESEEKELSERKLRKSGGNYLLAEVEEVLQNMQDFNQGDMVRLLKSLQAKSNFTLSMLNDSLRNTFKDSTHQHGALLLLQEAFADNAAALNVIDEAMGNLETTHGAQIRAGYNIAPLDDGFTDGTSEFQSPPAEKRLLYRDTILHFDSYIKTLFSLMDKYGEAQLPKALNFLSTALSLDMRAAHTSIDLAQLKEIADGITMMQNLTSIHQGTCRLLAQMEKMHGETQISARNIMEPLLFFKDLTVVSADTLRAKLPFLESENAVRDAALAQGVMSLLQELPHKVFANPDTRLQVIEAFKEIMEEITLREEALYD